MLRLTIGRLDLPLVTPFKTALRTVDKLSSLVVRLETQDGLVGFGEAPPTEAITGESAHSIAACWEERIAPCFKTLPPSPKLGNLRPLLNAIDRSVVGNTSAKAGIVTALFDLRAKALEQPLYKFLGGTRNELDNDLTISLNDPEEMQRDAKRATDAGYRILKLKVGQNIATDLERIAAVLEVIPEETRIRLDANQGWRAKEAVKRIAEIEKLIPNLEFIEQPVPAGDLSGLKFVTDNVMTPIMADESSFSPQDVIRLLERRACDLINIKLMKAGGIHRACLMADIAELYDVPCMLGCMLESNISVGAAAHVAGGHPNIRMIDLDGPNLMREGYTTEGSKFEGPTIRLNETPGLGITNIDSPYYTTIKEITV